MSESFREWGDYGAEEEWQSRPLIKKIFSFRTFKKSLKYFLIVIALCIYGLLAYRLITGLNVPKAQLKLLWTDNIKEEYRQNGTLTVYEQDPEQAFEEDGCFSVYSVKYIPSVSQLQLTVRYNKSTVKYLQEFYPDETLDESPFAYVLRDNNGNIYGNCSYSVTQKGRYTYLKLAFDNVKLFDKSVVPPEKEYFTPDGEYSDIIYKGIGMSQVETSNISYLYIDFYYENDVNLEEGSWSSPIIIYKNSLELKEYDVNRDKPSDSVIERQTINQH